MTTFQDPPPQSRRAVRQSERGEASTPVSDQAAPYAFDAAQDAAQGVTPESASAPVPHIPSHSGRRAQLPPTNQDAGSPAAGFEPLTRRGLPTSWPGQTSRPGDVSWFINRLRDPMPRSARQFATSNAPRQNEAWDRADDW